MKILIIDDEPLVRRSLERAFSKSVAKVLLAEDGKAGLQLWQEEKPDILFVDVVLPELGGPDLVREALQQNPSLQSALIILISAYSGDDSEKLKEDCGADYFVSKPFDDIFAVVEQTLSWQKNKASGEQKK